MVSDLNYSKLKSKLKSQNAMVLTEISFVEAILVSPFLYDNISHLANYKLAIIKISKYIQVVILSFYLPIVSPDILCLSKMK